MPVAAERPNAPVQQRGVALAAAAPLPPLSLYVHFPWCVRKCPYCDFNSYALRGALPESQYIDALLSDLAHEAPSAGPRTLQSIFFGGGTPSLFGPEALARLLEGICSALPLTDDAEVTLEANPGTVERGRFAEYRAAGVRRVSLGAQSFSDARLRALGRIHCAAETRRAAEELHAAGLSNFNLDLMYGLPDQDLAEALADLEAALALQPSHLSHYQLTLEPGTLFAAQPPARLPGGDESADMQQACRERLTRSGFLQYEISAYARAGARCRHNLNYWRFGDYLGIGAGAHGKCSRRRGGGLVVERSAKPREPRRYLAAVASGATGERRAVPARDLPFEFLMNALRLNEGFEEPEFEVGTGLPFITVAPVLTRLCGRGLLERRGQCWRGSARGLDLLNEVLAQLLPPP